MSNLRVGAHDPVALYWGEREVSAVYHGSRLIWPDGILMAVPVNRSHWSDFAPSVFAGVNVAVPADAVAWTDFVPDVFVHDEAVLPVNQMSWTDYAPVIAAGAHLSIPAADGVEWADFAPSVSISVAVRPPADAMAWADYAPVVVTGGAIEVPSDEAVWDSYAPSIAAGVNLAIPAGLMDWRDFGVVAGYGFSTGFDSGFAAIPGASGAAVPTDSMVLADFAPEVTAEAMVECEFLSYGGQATRSGAVHTLAGFDFGDEGAGRKIIVVVHAYRFGSTNMSLASATIGGVEATPIASASGTVTGVRLATYLIGAEVPNGTSGDIEITMGQSTSEIGIWAAGHRVMNLQSLVPASADNIGENGFSGNNNSRSAAADVPEGGLFLAAASVYHDDGSETFTGVTNDYFELVGNLHFTAGFEVVETAQVDKTATFTKSGGAIAMYGGIVGVGLR